MSDGQFWFGMALLVLGLDVLAILIRRGDEKERRLFWEEREAESVRRHKEFMRAVTPATKGPDDAR